MRSAYKKARPYIWWLVWVMQDRWDTWTVGTANMWSLQDRSIASHCPETTVFLFCVASVPISEHLVLVDWGGRKIPLFTSWGIFLNCLSLCLMSFVCWFVCFSFSTWALYSESSLKKRQSYTVLHYLLSHNVSAREVSKSSLAPRIEPGPRIIRRGLLPQHDTGARKLLEESVHLCVFSTLKGRYWIKCFLMSSLHL